MAFVVLQAGVAGSPDLAAELQQFVREQLAEYKRPRWVEFLPELPKTRDRQDSAVQAARRWSTTGL